jgi:hypothetical protein
MLHRRAENRVLTLDGTPGRWENVYYYAEASDEPIEPNPHLKKSGSRHST